MLRKLPALRSERILIREYLGWGNMLEHQYSGSVGLTEELVTGIVAAALRRRGFTLRSRGKGQRGPDVEAYSAREKVFVEAKGEGTAPDRFYTQLMVALGQVLTRMNDTKAKYVVALPWHTRYMDLIRTIPQSVRQKLRLQFWLVAPVSGELASQADYHVGVYSWDAS